MSDLRDKPFPLQVFVPFFFSSRSAYSKGLGEGKLALFSLGTLHLTATA